MPKRVLVVEDDGAVADMIASALRGRGYDVAVAASAEAGIEAARNSAPDMIFVSLLLQGGSNGLKVCKELHGVSGLGKVPVVMLISYPGELDPRHMTTIGVVGVLVKPLGESDIVAAAQRILGAAATPGEMAELDFGGDEEPQEAAADTRLELQAAEGFAAAPAHAPEEETGPGEDEPHLSYEIDEAEKGRPEGHAVPESSPVAAFEEGDAFEDIPEKGRDGTRKILMGVGVALIVAGVAFGGWQAKKYFFPSGKGGAPARQEPVAVKDNLPDVAKNEPTPAAVKEEAAAPKAETSAKAAPPAAKTQEAPVKAPQQAPPPAKAPAREKTKAVPAREAKAPGEAKQAPAAAPRAAVQVGVFGEEKNAAAMVGRLKKKGFDAYVLRDTAKGKGGKTIHRVLVGRFDDRRKAAVQATALEKEGIKSVIYPPKK